MSDSSKPTPVGQHDGLGLSPERAAFEAWLVQKGGWVAVPKKRENGTYISGQAQARWLGWQARAEHERTRCRYPECVENEDERCPRWLTGECEGPNVAGEARAKA